MQALARGIGRYCFRFLLFYWICFTFPFPLFTGAIETLAGLLLTTRRTTLLGALVALAALTHVFALNMCFDVPVKLYSFIYLLMAIFLAAPEFPRFIRVLVLGKAVEAKPFTPLLGEVKLDRLALALRTLLVVAMLYGQIHGSYRLWSDMYGGPPAPVVGRWELVSMYLDTTKHRP